LTHLAQVEITTFGDCALKPRKITIAVNRKGIRENCETVKKAQK